MEKLTASKSKVVFMGLILTTIIMMLLGGCSSLEKSFTEKESGEKFVLEKLQSVRCASWLSY